VIKAEMAIPVIALEPSTAVPPKGRLSNKEPLSCPQAKEVRSCPLLVTLLPAPSTSGQKPGHPAGSVAKAGCRAAGETRTHLVPVCQKRQG
jgi:hypothetical protein